MIYLNIDIKKGRSEFKQKNYKKALNYFEKIKEDDKDFEYATVFKISCLIELKQYGDALKLINPLIESNPYDELLWFDKVTCHIFLKEDEKALKALGEVERIVDNEDKSRLVYVAKFFNKLEVYDKAVEYCDKSLAIDENFKDALHEKSHAAIRLDDSEMIDEIADKFFEISKKDILSLTHVILLKLFAKNYSEALKIVENSVDDENKKETSQLFKLIIFKQICEDLDVQIWVNDVVDLSIDDALKLMLEFVESGKNHGIIKGVSYYIE